MGPVAVPLHAELYLPRERKAVSVASVPPRSASSGRRSVEEFEAYIDRMLSPLGQAEPSPGRPTDDVYPPASRPSLQKAAAPSTPAVDSSPASTPPPRRDPTVFWDDTGLVLRDLDRLRGDLSTSEAVSPTTAPSAPDPAVEPGGRPTGDGWGIPTLYLDERLRLAHSAAEVLGRESEEFDRRWRTLQTTISTINRELERANKEMEFVRSMGWTAPPAEPATEGSSKSPPFETGPPPTSPPVPQRPVVAPAPQVGAVPPYGEFTVRRYNETVVDLRSRRRKLLLWTLASAALISAVLVTVTAIYREPTPPLWLAALPIVWMIPVPFFVLSFRGTQRVLRRNHLTLEETA